MIIELKTKTRLFSNRRNRMLLTLISPGWHVFLPYEIYMKSSFQIEETECCSLWLVRGDMFSCRMKFMWNRVFEVHYFCKIKRIFLIYQIEEFRILVPNSTVYNEI